MNEPLPLISTADALRLIADGADICTQDARGRTPVMAATPANCVEMVGALISAGADTNIRDDLKDNPFLYAGLSRKGTSIAGIRT